jgi:phosphohistidine phosphatase
LGGLDQKIAGKLASARFRETMFPGMIPREPYRTRLRMKTLYLLRHAKSSWQDAGLADRDRPLNDRGVVDARAMGAVIAARPRLPDLVLCSTATRTRQTIDLVLPALEPRPDIRYLDELYMASAQRLLKIVREIEESVECAMLIGHNEGLHDFARLMAGAGDLDTLQRLVAKLPTAGFVHLDLGDRIWAYAVPKCGQLEAFATPRETMS